MNKQDVRRFCEGDIEVARHRPVRGPVDGRLVQLHGRRGDPVTPESREGRRGERDSEGKQIRETGGEHLRRSEQGGSTGVGGLDEDWQLLYGPQETREGRRRLGPIVECMRMSTVSSLSRLRVDYTRSRFRRIRPRLREIDLYTCRQCERG